MATSIAGYRGRNWTDRLSAFASLLLCAMDRSSVSLSEFVYRSHEVNTIGSFWRCSLSFCYNFECHLQLAVKLFNVGIWPINGYWRLVECIYYNKDICMLSVPPGSELYSITMKVKKLTIGLFFQKKFFLNWSLSCCYGLKVEQWAWMKVDIWNTMDPMRKTTVEVIWWKLFDVHLFILFLS